MEGQHQRGQKHRVGGPSPHSQARAQAQVAVSYEHCEEPTDYTKCKEFRHRLSDYQFLKDSTTWL
jgi:hypothetical protein